MATTIDRRRNNGPAFSSPPVFAAVEGDAADVTMDDREAGPPTFFLQTGLVAKCNGSAYYEGDGIKLVASVHGPRPLKQSSTTSGGGGDIHTAAVTVEAKFAPFAVPLDRPRRGYQRDTSERFLGETVRMALQKAIRTKAYPKSEISLHLMVLEVPAAAAEQDDTEARVVAASINAFSAALADAAIEMVDLVSSVAVTAKDGTGVVIGYMPHREELTLVHSTGAGDATGENEAAVGLLVQEAIERAKVVNLAISKVLIS